MADQRAQYNEEAVGANHPTKADVINRLALVEHNTDGTHKMGATPAAIGTAFQQIRVNSGMTALEFFTPTEGLPLGYLSGLTIAHAADTEHDITVAAGKARDSTDAADMVLASAITKRFDAEWAVGTTEGGFASGESLPASGTIHIWLIKRSDTGVVDVFANDHATSGLTPTLPTDYDYKRRIFSLRTDGSNNIINGDQWGTGPLRRFMYDTPIMDISAANQSTYYGGALAALSVPAGIMVQALWRATASPGSGVIFAPDNANIAIPAINASPLRSMLAHGEGMTKTNTSSQVMVRAEQNNADKVYLLTIGWEDSL